MTARKWQNLFDSKWFRLVMCLVCLALIITLIGVWKAPHKYSMEVSVDGKTQPAEIVLKYRNFDAWTGFRTFDGSLEIFLDPNDDRANYAFSLGRVMGNFEYEGTYYPPFVISHGFARNDPHFDWMTGFFYFDSKIKNFALLSEDLELFHGDDGFSQTVRNYSTLTQAD